MDAQALCARLDEWAMSAPDPAVVREVVCTFTSAKSAPSASAVSKASASAMAATLASAAALHERSRAPAPPVGLFVMLDHLLDTIAQSSDAPKDAPAPSAAPLGLLIQLAEVAAPDTLAPLASELHAMIESGGAMGKGERKKLIEIYGTIVRRHAASTSAASVPLLCSYLQLLSSPSSSLLDAQQKIFLLLTATAAACASASEAASSALVGALEAAAPTLHKLPKTLRHAYLDTHAALLRAPHARCALDSPPLSLALLELLISHALALDDESRTKAVLLLAEMDNSPVVLRRLLAMSSRSADAKEVLMRMIQNEALEDEQRRRANAKDGGEETEVRGPRSRGLAALIFAMQAGDCSAESACGPKLGGAQSSLMSPWPSAAENAATSNAATTSNRALEDGLLAVLTACPRPLLLRKVDVLCAKARARSKLQRAADAGARLDGTAAPPGGEAAFAAWAMTGTQSKSAIALAAASSTDLADLRELELLMRCEALSSATSAIPAIAEVARLRLTSAQPTEQAIALCLATHAVRATSSKAIATSLSKALFHRARAHIAHLASTTGSEPTACTGLTAAALFWAALACSEDGDGSAAVPDALAASAGRQAGGASALAAASARDGAIGGAVHAAAEMTLRAEEEVIELLADLAQAAVADAGQQAEAGAHALDDPDARTAMECEDGLMHDAPRAGMLAGTHALEEAHALVMAGAHPFGDGGVLHAHGDSGMLTRLRVAVLEGSTAVACAALEALAQVHALGTSEDGALADAAASAQLPQQTEGGENDGSDYMSLEAARQEAEQERLEALRANAERACHTVGSALEASIADTRAPLVFQQAAVRSVGAVLLAWARCTDGERFCLPVLESALVARARKAEAAGKHKDAEDDDQEARVAAAPEAIRAAALEQVHALLAAGYEISQLGRQSTEGLLYSALEPQAPMRCRVRALECLADLIESQRCMPVVSRLLYATLDDESKVASLAGALLAHALAAHSTASKALVKSIHAAVLAGAPPPFAADRLPLTLAALQVHLDAVSQPGLLAQLGVDLVKAMCASAPFTPQRRTEAARLAALLAVLPCTARSVAALREMKASALQLCATDASIGQSLCAHLVTWLSTNGTRMSVASSARKAASAEARAPLHEARSLADEIRAGQTAVALDGTAQASVGAKRAATSELAEREAVQRRTGRMQAGHGCGGEGKQQVDDNDSLAADVDDLDAQLAAVRALALARDESEPLTSRAHPAAPHASA